jgi:hypothetical protein
MHGPMNVKQLHSSLNTFRLSATRSWEGESILLDEVEFFGMF